MNYTLYRKDRMDGYGGVMIAVSKQIQSVPLPDLQTSCEILWVKLNFQNCRDLYLEAFYRPHVSDQFSLEQLNNSLNKLTNQPCQQPYNMVIRTFQLTRHRMANLYNSIWIS